MNRKELTDELASRLGTTKTFAAAAVEALFSPVPGRGIIAERLTRGEKVVITGFGTFHARPVRRGSAGRGTSASQPTRTAAFRPGLPLRDRLR